MSSEASFGSWLRQQRDKLGVTQEDFSNQLGFSLALLRKLESSERRPSGQVATLIAEYFKIPSDELEAFIVFARTGDITFATSDAATPGNSTPWRRVYLRKTNLPTILTPIIGRQQEKETAIEHILHSKTRLVTLTGTPGIGKTRLGLEIASGVVENFEDGVFFVDLAPIVDPDMVIEVIARTLGLKEAPNRSFEIVVLDYLRERRLLLFLDNFEQVLDAATILVRLLEACPWLKVLITSREALQVRGERRLNVPPLELPDLKQSEPLALLRAYPGVELFVERARAVTPDFELNSENTEDVVAICVGLEGVPLALELAAARIRHFSPRELNFGLGSRLKLLSSGARDLPARHRTLRNAIEWSYDLLNPNEQRLFRFAGQFVGGFTAEALNWVEANQPDQAVSVLDTLMALLDKNLVRSDRKPKETRYSLLEAIREYAIEQLEKQGEIVEARLGHSNYYLELAERAEQHFTGSQYLGWGADQIKWMDKLEADLVNIRVVLGWYQAQLETTLTQENGEVNPLYLETLQKGLRLAIALRRIWLARGHFIEGVQWLTAFLAKVPKPLPHDSRFQATYATALAVVGRLTPISGNATIIRPLLEESLSIATRLGDKQLTALILLISGTLALEQADYEAARLFQKEGLKLYRELNNKWGAAAVLQDLGEAELNQGNFNQARPMLEESLQLFREIGDGFGTASVLVSLGTLAYEQGEYAEAGNLWHKSLKLCNEIGYASLSGYSLVMLGWTALREGKHTEAKTYLKEGIQQGQIIGAVLTVYWGLVGLGTLAQDAQKAAVIFGAAEAYSKVKNILLSSARQVELEQAQTTVQTQISNEEWDKAWSKGYELIFKGTNPPMEGPFKFEKGIATLLEAF